MSDSTIEQPTRDGEDDPTDRDHAAESDHAHLDGVEDGCGCAEVWEHLSEQREAEASSD